MSVNAIDVVYMLAGIKTALWVLVAAVAAVGAALLMALVALVRKA